MVFYGADRFAGFLAALAKNSAGNTLALIAAAIAPIMALVGGGIDMGRSYLAEARLQQACDSGVLAARKRLGSEAAVTGMIPPETGEVGQRFFNVNFRGDAYGTHDRQFTMFLEDNFAISGEARVTVPTTIMRIFGFNEVPIKVSCEAQINVNNTDVMMVLDVTGSMAQTNPGDELNKIDTLKQTVRGFYLQLQAAALAGTRIRYGFVPYSTNVNVGGLLQDDWVVSDWGYQSRQYKMKVGVVTTFEYNTSSRYVSGLISSQRYQTYAAQANGANGYKCSNPPKADVQTSSTSTTKKEAVLSPVPGTKETTTYTRTRNGSQYSVELYDKECRVTKVTYQSYVDQYDHIKEPALGLGSQWLYDRLARDVSNWRAEGNGCMEERDTYEIDNFENVDLGRALDLDLDRRPTPGEPGTQWRPMYPGIVYARALEWSGKGSFSPKAVTTDKEFVAPGSLGTAACPPAAMKMSEIDADDLDRYLATLRPDGSTYHDIGMIWGGRLISPTGLFASENADVGADSPTSRNLIFLTDGETAPSDISYSSYGIEPLDRRRWNPKSRYSLTQTVEQRFAFACTEVKRRNVTVWVIGFGTELSPLMKDCAGPEHFFEAADAAELNASFAAIAKNMSRLRLER